MSYAVDELMVLVGHYRLALCKIRENSIPFTREWRLANDALQKPPKFKHEPVQLEMTFLENFKDE